MVSMAVESKDENSEKEMKFLGVAKPFPQGGVWRLTIPKKIVKIFGLLEKKKDEPFYFMFFKDQDGLVLKPLGNMINTINVQGNALNFADLSNLSEEDIELLFDEDDEE